ncbi:MAG: hypothetical protein KDB69_00155, partial [Acidimicrobiia bacterium]|nr:hypothetical protein [Acidimicrobiia bacterium]
MSNDDAPEPDIEPKALPSAAQRTLLVVMTAYIAVTLSESLLAPSLPLVSSELGLNTGASARILGLVSLAAGVGNLVGGWLLGLRSARFTTLVA